jgi:hypothetical protein
MGGRRMKVLLYARGPAETGNQLQNFLETHVPGCKTEVYRTIEGLAERLKAPHEGGVVAVLRADNREDLMALLSIRLGLQNVRTILLAPDREDTTIALAHQLRPRFLSYINNDLDNVSAVLEKMLKTGG